MNHKENPLGTAPVGRLLLQYAIPSIISTLIASLYNMVDQMFIGQRIGFLGNAATTVAYPLTFLCGALTLLFSNGSAVNFNVCNGRGQKEEALDFAGAGLTLLTAEGLFTTALVFLFTPQIANLFGATRDVYPYALTYIRLVALGFPFLAITSGGTLLIRSDGSPRFALVCSMAGVALNFILDYLFLFPLNMGIAGAAVATVLGQIASAILVISYMLRFKTGKLLRNHFAVTKDKVTQIMSIGAAGSLNQAAMLVMNLVLNSSLRYYGAMSEYGGSEALAAAGADHGLQLRSQKLQAGERDRLHDLPVLVYHRRAGDALLPALPLSDPAPFRQQRRGLRGLCPALYARVYDAGHSGRRPPGLHECHGLDQKAHKRNHHLSVQTAGAHCPPAHPAPLSRHRRRADHRPDRGFSGGSRRLCRGPQGFQPAPVIMS